MKVGGEGAECFAKYVRSINIQLERNNSTEHRGDCFRNASLLRTYVNIFYPKLLKGARVL